MKVLIKYDDSWLKDIYNNVMLDPYIWTEVRDNAMAFESNSYDFSDLVCELFDADYNPLTIERA